MPYIDSDLPGATTEEPTYPPPDGSLVPYHLSCGRIKALATFCSDSMPLDVETQGKEWRECVRQIQKHGCRNNGDETKVVWNSCCEEKRYSPPDWNDSSIDNLPTLSNERRRVEDIQEYVVVEDFDTDVAVKACSNQASDQSDHVTSSLPAIGTDSLVARVEAILPLKVINVTPIDEINAVYEELRSPHRFNEVSRTLSSQPKTPQKAGHQHMLTHQTANH